MALLLLHPPPRRETCGGGLILHMSSSRRCKDSPNEEVPSPLLSESATCELKEQGFTVIDDFIDVETVESLRRDVQNLRQAGRFHTTARNEQLSAIDQEMRLGESCFLNKNNMQLTEGVSNQARSRTLEQLGCLRDVLGAMSKVDLEPSLDDLLYVYYPTGGFYKRHVDTTPESHAVVLRVFSILLYLNEQSWSLLDGGQLRMFPPNGGYVDVLPTGGRLVVFQSDLIPHEVLETARPRMALVGWFNRAAATTNTKMNGGI